MIVKRGFGTHFACPRIFDRCAFATVVVDIHSR
jgi:hypothetical protein